MSNQEESVKRYVYFFTRQDISPEQQLVQTAHIAYKLGIHVGGESTTQDPDNTYFIVIGVPNLEGLKAVQNILTMYCRRFETFFEPDIGEITSIATYPISEPNRDELLAFSLLKF